MSNAPAGLLVPLAKELLLLWTMPSVAGANEATRCASLMGPLPAGRSITWPLSALLATQLRLLTLGLVAIAGLVARSPRGGAPEVCNSWWKATARPAATIDAAQAPFEDYFENL